jgi:predicted HNH restriction endonuclease
MVSRLLIKNDPLLRSSAIVNVANATVFRLDEAEFLRFSQLWGDAYKRESDVFDVGAIEGGVYLRRHRMRERSRHIVRKKLEHFRSLHGALHCEVCALPEFGSYPQDLAASVFEVHHLVPLSGSDVLRRTTLEELAVVCANCHRAIHATPDIQHNMEAVKTLWTQRRL